MQYIAGLKDPNHTPLSNYQLSVVQPLDKGLVAVMGAHVSLPSGSDSIWAMLSKSHNSVRRVPSQRFDIIASIQAAPALIYVQHGHYVNSPELFDRSVFRMSPVEVRATDPSHRMVLESVFVVCIQARRSERLLLATTATFVALYNVAEWGTLQHEHAVATTVLILVNPTYSVRGVLGG